MGCTGSKADAAQESKDGAGHLNNEAGEAGPRDGQQKADVDRQEEEHAEAARRSREAAESHQKEDEATERDRQDCEFIEVVQWNEAAERDRQEKAEADRRRAEETQATEPSAPAQIGTVQNRESKFNDVVLWNEDRKAAGFKMPNGDRVTIVDTTGDEYKVIWRGREGWVKKHHIQAAPWQAHDIQASPWQAHDFQPLPFRTFTFCAVCSGLLWGFGNRGQRCTICDEARCRSCACKNDPCRVHIICIGNPGCGKSTLLNSMIGHAIFKSGFSAGCGLTNKCEKQEQGPVTYVDTPGLADAKGRERAASAISVALNANARCKILFVTTLEAGQVRPEDHATMELVLEALLEAGISDRGVAVIINKVRGQEGDKMLQRGFKFDKLEALAGGRREELGAGTQKENLSVNRVICVEEDGAIEDKDQQMLKLSPKFKDFISSMPSVFIGDHDVGQIHHDRFERLVKTLRHEIRKLNYDNQKLRDGIQLVHHADVRPQPEEHASGDVVPTHENHGFKQGETVILIDAFLGGGQMTMSAGEQGQVRADSANEELISVKFDIHPDAVSVPREKLCSLEQVDSLKTATVRELAFRGIELGEILKFYASLGRSVMMDFNPDESTTFQVVRDAIIPRTLSTRKAYASHVHKTKRRAERMVCHNWGSRFACTVAAVVADAYDEPLYNRFLELLAPPNIERLVEDLKEQNKLKLTYWICPFSVNQHRSICKDATIQCPCSSAIHGNKSPLCEMDQFDKMMTLMFEERSETQRQVIAIDKCGEVFRRAWVVAEVAQVLISMKNVKQAFKAFDEVTLKDIRARGNVSIHDCEASRPEDRTMIVDKVRGLMKDRGFTDELFHENLSKRVFGLLEVTLNEVEKMKKKHIMFIGNEGVGKTTLVKALIGRDAFANAIHRDDVFHEFHHDDKVFLIAKGLADMVSRERAAKAITSALMRDGRYMLLFIVTLEAGRVRPQDKETMELVLQSASAANIKHNYSVIINKLTRRAIQKFQDKAEFGNIRQEFRFGCETDYSPHIRWVEKVSEACPLRMPNHLLTDAPDLYIRCSKVHQVQSETPEIRMNMKKNERDVLERENKILQEKLRDKQNAAALKIRAEEFFHQVDDSIRLNLDYRGIDDEKAKAIATVLPDYGSLQILDLSRNQIGDEGAKAIATALSSCTSLQELSFFGNQIGDNGAKSIATALPSCTSLTSLNLGTNKIGDAGARAIAGVLPSTSLTSLNLATNKIGIDGAKALRNAWLSVPGRKVHLGQILVVDALNLSLNPGSYSVSMENLPLQS